MNTNYKRKKRSYSTEFKRAYLTGLLPPSLVNNIPSSTRSSWRNKSLHNLYGYDFIYANDEQLDFYQLKERYDKLIKVTKALALMVMCFSEIIYSFSYRKKFLKESQVLLIKTIKLAANLVTLNRTLRWMKISHQQYYAWINKVDCGHSLMKLCLKKYPHQLSNKEINVVKEYVTDEAYLHWSIPSIYCQMLRKAKTFMSLATFRKYAKWTNPNLSNRRKKLEKNWKGLRANTSKQILHMDVTIFRPSDHSKVYLYFILDNFSRAILGWKASLQYSSEIALENLKEVCNKYDLSNSSVQLVVDDGPENNGCVNDFLSIPGIQLKKLIAQLDIRQSNSMIEAANKRIKYDYLFTKELLDFHAAKTYLSSAIESFNNKPLDVLSAYTPLEVLHGAVPDKNRFKDQTRIAVQERKLSNKQQVCCVL